MAVQCSGVDLNKTVLTAMRESQDDIYSHRLVTTTTKMFFSTEPVIEPLTDSACSRYLISAGPHDAQARRQAVGVMQLDFGTL